MSDFDIVIGIHSIVEALRARNKALCKLYVTDEGMSELKKRAGATAKDFDGLKIIKVDSHQLQEEGEESL